MKDVITNILHFFMQRSVIIVALLLVIVAGSCKRSSTAPAYSSNIPWNLDSLMPSTNTVALSNSHYLDVAGVFVANKITGDLTDTSGVSVAYYRSWQATVFPGDSNYVSGVSSVSVNGLALNSPVWNNPFLCHYDSSVATWNETGTDHWETPGSSLVPVISQDVAGTMPALSGALPTTIDTTHDFTFTFNGDNTSNAEFGFVIVYGPSRGAGIDPMISDVVSASGGTVTFSAARLKDIYNGSFRPGTAANDPVCYGGYIMVVLYNHEVHSFGGKPYAFVRQREYLGVVKFM
jgi:hypothetical protein